MNNDSGTPSAPDFGQPEQPQNPGGQSFPPPPPSMPQYPTDGPPAYNPPGYGPPGGGYPPAGPPPGYGQPGGFYQPPNHPQSTTILVLGIVGLACCALAAPFAWIMGGRALREIDANPAAYGGRGQVQAGRILGIIGCVLAILLVIFYIIIFAVAIGTDSSSFEYETY